MQSEIAKAVDLFRSSPELEDGDIQRMLVERGVDRILAWRLVEFIPMAYCRVVLEPTGARFPKTFQRYQRDGTISPEIPVESEPVWVAATDYARREMEAGISLQHKLSVAGRSAEFKVANDLLTAGSKLSDIGFTPTLLMWPEEGPNSEQSAKPWWRFWR